jgi:hypothetical protein
LQRQQFFKPANAFKQLMATKFVSNSDGVNWFTRRVERTNRIKNVSVRRLVELVWVNSAFYRNANRFSREQHGAEQ